MVADPESPRVNAPVPPAEIVRAALVSSSAEVMVTMPASFLTKVKVASASSAISIESEFAPVMPPPVTDRSPLMVTAAASISEIAPAVVT